MDKEIKKGESWRRGYMRANDEHPEKEVIKEFMDKQEEWETKLKELVTNYSAKSDFNNREGFAKFLIYNLKPLIIKSLRSKDRDTLIEKLDGIIIKKPTDDITHIRIKRGAYNHAISDVKQIILEVYKNN